MASGLGHIGGEHRRHIGGMPGRFGWAAFDASPVWTNWNVGVLKFLERRGQIGSLEARKKEKKRKKKSFYIY